MIVYVSSLLIAQKDPKRLLIHFSKSLLLGQGIAPFRTFQTESMDGYVMVCVTFRYMHTSVAAIRHII